MQGHPNGLDKAPRVGPNQDGRSEYMHPFYVEWLITCKLTVKATPRNQAHVPDEAQHPVKA